MTDEDDNRIVQGGELNVEGLENVVGTSSSTPAPGTTNSSQMLPTGDMGNVYTLSDRVIKFLENTVTNIENVDPNVHGSLKINSLLQNKAIQTLASKLGADFLTLSNYRFNTSYWGGGSPYLVADLDMIPLIPKSSFKKGLSALLGGEESVKYLFSTDIASALGLDDPTKPVNLNDQHIDRIFPDITQIKNLKGTYAVPIDPYLFLLSVSPQYRRFLSVCLDLAKKEASAPFNATGVKDYGLNVLRDFGISKRQLEDIYNTGFLGLSVIVKTGQQYGLRELKPYLDALSTLRDTLKTVKAQ